MSCLLKEGVEIRHGKSQVYTNHDIDNIDECVVGNKERPTFQLHHTHINKKQKKNQTITLVFSYTLHLSRLAYQKPKLKKMKSLCTIQTNSIAFFSFLYAHLICLLLLVDQARKQSVGLVLQAP